MTTPWEPNFGFYLTTLDEHPASFVVDLNAEPTESHSLRLQLRVPLRPPRDDGLRDAAEFLFYVPSEHGPLLDDLEALLGPVAPYEVEYLAAEDPDWGMHTEFLFPDAYSLQSIANRTLLEQLEKAGDVMSVARTIDHLAFFESAAQANEAASRLKAAGFSTDELATREDDRVGLQFHRDDALSDGQADAFVAEVLDIMGPLGGEYGGWGCPVVTTEPQPVCHRNASRPEVAPWNRNATAQPLRSALK